MSIWIYYFDGHGGPLLPAGILKHGTDRTAYDAAGVNVEDNYCNYVETLDNLGNPISVAADAAHRYGIELYACFKPYETGISLLLPQGSHRRRANGDGSCSAAAM